MAPMIGADLGRPNAVSNCGNGKRVGRHQCQSESRRELNGDILENRVFLLTSRAVLLYLLYVYDNHGPLLTGQWLYGGNNE